MANIAQSEKVTSTLSDNLKISTCTESKIVDLEKNKHIPELFIIYIKNRRYYYVNEEYAKKNLFDLTMKYYNTEDEDEYEDDDENKNIIGPYLDAFGKGKKDNLQLLYTLTLDIENLCKFSTKEKCTLVNVIGRFEHNTKFKA